MFTDLQKKIIKRTRYEVNYSAEELAKKLSVTPQGIRNAMRGLCMPYSNKFEYNKGLWVKREYTTMYILGG
jgi:transcriptional regulator with XRE-family HTH domain